MRQTLRWLDQNSMTEAAHVGERVSVVVLVCGSTGSFEVNHDLFPALRVNWLHCHAILLGRAFPETDARQAFIYPSFHICLQRFPINDSLHDLDRLRT